MHTPAKIGNLQIAPVVNQQILGFDVAVDYVLAVQVLECTRKLTEYCGWCVVGVCMMQRVEIGRKRRRRENRVG